MGYACPVCADPQADAEHLADHLAFTAMLGDDDHEAWLDEHAPGWGENDAAALAERVVDGAEAVTFPQVFEDTTGPDSGIEDDHEHAHDERSGSPLDAGGGRAHRGSDHDAETRRILSEARDLTREMLEDDDRDERE